MKKDLTGIKINKITQNVRNNSENKTGVFNGIKKQKKCIGYVNKYKEY